LDLDIFESITWFPSTENHTGVTTKSTVGQSEWTDRTNSFVKKFADI